MIYFLNGIDNDIWEDIIIAIDNIIQESDEFKINAADTYDMNMKVMEFYDWQSEKKRCIVLLRMTNPLIDKIHHVIIQRHLALYCLLKKDCRRTMQFLRNNRKILKSSKLRWRQEQNLCCKYHLLKQLIAYCYYGLIDKLNKATINEILRNM